MYAAGREEKEADLRLTAFTLVRCLGCQIAGTETPTAGPRMQEGDGIGEVSTALLMSFVATGPGLRLVTGNWAFQPGRRTQ